MESLWVMVFLTLWKHTPPYFGIETEYSQKNNLDIVERTYTFESNEECNSELFKMFQKDGGEIKKGASSDVEYHSSNSLSDTIRYCHEMKI